eukprot:1428167-Amphidinium_carterae.1
MRDEQETLFEDDVRSQNLCKYVVDERNRTSNNRGLNMPLMWSVEFFRKWSGNNIKDCRVRSGSMNEFKTNINIMLRR